MSDYVLVELDINRIINEDKIIQDFQLSSIDNIDDITNIIYTKEMNFNKSITVTIKNSNCYVIKSINVSKLSSIYVGYIIHDCDVKGNISIPFESENTTDNSNKTKWLYKQLKTKNFHTYGNIYHGENPSMIYSCPLCLKTNLKCIMYLNSFHTVSFSKTDCNDDNHLEYFKRLRIELKNKWENYNNPDFTAVKWNLNYTFYEIDLDGKKTIKANDYWNQYSDFLVKPPIKLIKPLKIIENFERLMDHYQITIKLNQINLKFEIWENDKILSDNLENYIIILYDKCTKHNWKLTKDQVYDYCIKLARQNHYNPFSEWLVENYHKNKNKVDDIYFKEFLDTIESDHPQKNIYIIKFMLQLVYINMDSDNNRIGNEFALILAGNQGIGKTRWFMNLLPDDFTSYFLEGRTINLNNKDSILEFFSSLLVEMGEIASTYKKSDQEQLKNFITSKTDRVRPPYFRSFVDKKRITALCGTTNDAEFLKDVTGTRRYLSIECTNINYNHDFDMDLIWTVIYQKYMNNETFWFNKDEIRNIENYNRVNFTIKEDNHLILEETFNLYPEDDDGNWLTANEIRALIPLEYITDLTIQKLGKLLTKLKVKKKKTTTKRLYYIKIL